MPKWNSFVLQGFCQNGKNCKKARILPKWQETRIIPEKQENKNHVRIARTQESDKNCKNTRIRQEYKNTRILPGETFLASPAKILSTRILPERQDLFFQARILYRRNDKRILSDVQEKQESGQNEDKIVD